LPTGSSQKLTRDLRRTFLLPGKIAPSGIQEAPNKSTLSYANAHRPWQMYQELFYKTLELCKLAGTGKHRFKFKTSCCRWTAPPYHFVCRFSHGPNFDGPKGAMKLHLLLDHAGYLPTYAYISNGKKHDVTIARKVPLSPYSIVAMDKGTTTTVCLHTGAKTTSSLLPA
jgi:hypothetical protein